MYTLESFCDSIWGIGYREVKRRINKDDYKTFYIPKKNGFRTINYLDENSTLQILQKKLLIFLEKQCIPVCVKGFVKGESYLTFLSEHVNANYYLRIDIKSFFPSITEKHIEKSLSTIISSANAEEKSNIIRLIRDIVTLDGTLPQGACTSPAISNIVMSRLDQRVLKYCQLFGIRYSRYADDLVFSSIDFDFQNKPWFLKKIRYILLTDCFKLNYSKIKYGINDLRINGYVVSSDGIRLSRSKLSDIRHVISYVKNNCEVLKQGNSADFLSGINTLVLNHRDLIKNPFVSVYQVQQYMSGQRAFLLSVIQSNLSNADASSNVKLQHTISKLESQIICIAKCLVDVKKK